MLKVTSTIASYSPLNISETVRDRGFVKDHQQERVYGESKYHTMTSRDPERSNSWPQYDQSPISRKQLEMPFSNNRYINSLPWGSTVGYPSDSLASSSCSVNDVIYSIVSSLDDRGSQQLSQLSNRSPMFCPSHQCWLYQCPVSTTSN